MKPPEIVHTAHTKEDLVEPLTPPHFIPPLTPHNIPRLESKKTNCLAVPTGNAAAEEGNKKLPRLKAEECVVTPNDPGPEK